ncbi:MAG: hypothetical protein ACYTEK_14470 [Planctomycetota bacterium]|jgi:hypothetical protein
MNKHAIITGLCLCILPATQAQAKSNDNAGAPTITVTKLDATDKTLELNYQIKNESEQDIWICEGFNPNYRNFEVELTEDGATLFMRRRLDVAKAGFGAMPSGLYIRVPKGDTRKGSLLLLLPVRPLRVFLWGRRPDKVVEHTTRLTMEIGFYSGNLPGMVFGLLEEGEMNPQDEHFDTTGYPTDVVGWLSGSLYFNCRNEGLPSREDQVIIPWTNQTLKGEQAMRATLDDVQIPYIESAVGPQFKPLDLRLCTRTEIVCTPSILDYFFPYPTQQRLLSSTETSHLRSLTTVTSDNLELIKVMADEINERGFCQSQIVTEHGAAHLNCYRANERQTSFTVYDDTSIETEDQQLLWLRGNLRSMSMLAPQTAPFEWRLDCAANLKGLWYRFRLYHKAEEMQAPLPLRRSEPAYPKETKWCDDMKQAYEKSIGMADQYLMKPYKCPSAGEGKCHYAMNPNCQYDSPADMVLLFETKAGWNQHGGPELFTFDNHDPRGGCVLLNDGTVKFIRTAEELRQLRWK